MYSDIFVLYVSLCTQVSCCICCIILYSREEKLSPQAWKIFSIGWYGRTFAFAVEMGRAGAKSKATMVCPLLALKVIRKNEDMSVLETSDSLPF
ncbi:hypothetical protein T310_0991 [Rasamsonia emersonii CBS 393.64]|uniref:Uncharacterized protein n=1 Tax=Rasamsonia emersonii (strain ATCC 16479 / CBS 393.64 / IMI 116815) TaxID=1408163 RepID=A0A0F4Z374_RASE3|nr:hypothetical protein T310_0991 [Rasamsonia emersonii CBS 393.64]KKA24957.1 hypothetical protein T310_0991 [Rasamsonia emersonii CBS 393.64]